MRKHREKIPTEELKPIEKSKPRIKKGKESLAQLEARKRLYEATSVKQVAIDEIDEKIRRKKSAMENMDRKQPNPSGKEIKLGPRVFFPETGKLKEKEM